MIKSLDERLKDYQPLWENWFIDSLIYNGANSRVYKIKRNRDGADEYAALKVVTITLENDMFVSGADSLKYLEDRCRNAKTEIGNMIKLERSPYIVSYYDDVTKEIKDQDDGSLSGYDILIRMEYLECFGARVRKKDAPVTVQDVINMAYDVGSALKDVHKHNMIHRDIKPDNIFIDDQGYYKLGDLGVTKSINASGYASTRTGTEPYAAPEVWKCDSSSQMAYTFKADIYSFGIVLYQLLNNNLLPFMTQFTHNELEKSVSMRMRGERVPQPANGSERFKEIVCRMCDPDPEKRFKSMGAFLSAMADVGTREESTAGSDSLELSESFPQDSIPTVDANEGFEYIDTEGIDAVVDAGTYMGRVGVDDPEKYFPQQPAPETKPDENSTDSKLKLFRPEKYEKKVYRYRKQSENVPETEVQPEVKAEALPKINTEPEEKPEVSAAFATHMPERRTLTGAESEFRTFYGNYEVVEKINRAAGVKNKKIVSPDGVFRVADFRRTGVRNGVLEIPAGYNRIDPFISVNIERIYIEKMIIPAGVDDINDEVFRGLPNLREVVLPEDIKVIRKTWFAGCAGLERVIASGNLKLIEDHAFKDCSSLKYIDIPSKERVDILKGAFEGCDDFRVRCKKGSLLHQYCVNRNIGYEISDGEAES